MLNLLPCVTKNAANILHRHPEIIIITAFLTNSEEI